MDFWTKYGPLVAKQAELVSSLSSDLECLTKDSERANKEAQDAKAQIAQLKTLLSSVSSGKQDSIEQERAYWEAFQKNHKETWRSSLAENQKLKTELESMIKWKLEAEQQLESLSLTISELKQRDQALQRENEWLIEQIQNGYDTESASQAEEAQAQSQAEEAQARSQAEEAQAQTQAEQVLAQSQAEEAQTQAEQVLAQSQAEQEQTQVQAEEPRAKKNRAKRPQKHPTGDFCRVSGCGAQESSFWRPNTYGKPEYGSRICNACYERNRSKQKKYNPPKPHPSGLCCQVPGCGVLTASMWRSNNTGNPGYGQLICNVCWVRARRSQKYD